MECEECRAHHDEYVYGETPPSLSARVAAHLAACEACARECEQLRVEREFFGRCVVEASPSLADAVRVRVAAERAPRPAGRFGGLHAWLLALRRPAFAAAVAAVVVAGVLGAAGYLWPLPTGEGGGGVAQLGESAAGPHVLAARQPDESVVNHTPPLPGPAAPAPVGRASAPKRRRDGARRADEVEMTRPHRDAPGAQPRAVARGASARPASAERASEPVIIRSTGASDLDAEIARHIEQSQMLLRSFRNARLAGGDLDLDYERRASRNLLKRNVLLRRDVESGNREAAGALLARLEPLLRDIANLEGGPDAESVRLIKERLRSEEIVPLLRLY